MRSICSTFPKDFQSNERRELYVVLGYQHDSAHRTWAVCYNKRHIGKESRPMLPTSIQLSFRNKKGLHLHNDASTQILQCFGSWILRVDYPHWSNLTTLKRQDSSHSSPATLHGCLQKACNESQLRLKFKLNVYLRRL